MPENNKSKILIVDDSEINREILKDLLDEEYEILEARNGLEAVEYLKNQDEKISLILLDYIMPEMDGLELLSMMNDRHWIEEVPVIMITSDNAADSIDKAYDLGVSDFVSRPYNASIIEHRIENTIALKKRQKQMQNLLIDQVKENEQSKDLLINILSHVVEFRNGESGRHVINIRLITELLLRKIKARYPQYHLTESRITTISLASSLHDIGKIAIPEEILNKPGRLTSEEFSEMEKHPEIGYKMLQALPNHKDDPLVKEAMNITRWHHERYDGKGYPDGLVKDEIPISAQVVAVADVYDALTSERVYKRAIPHTQSIRMILDGKCGVFNPILMEVLKESQDEIEAAMQQDITSLQPHDYTLQQAEDLIRKVEEEPSGSAYDYQKQKYDYFANHSQQLQFEYSFNPPILTLSKWVAEKLDLSEVVINPQKNETIQDQVEPKILALFTAKVEATTPANPDVDFTYCLSADTNPHWMRMIGRTIFDEKGNPENFLGIVSDIHEEKIRIDDLEKKASHDGLTGLVNQQSCKERAESLIRQDPSSNYCLIIIDLDHFKEANDEYGHHFGDEVLAYFSKRLKHSIRKDDIAGRIGGDEFMICLQYGSNIQGAVDRIFKQLKMQYKDYPIRLSMGIAQTETISRNYEELFNAADKALYQAKKQGRNCYVFAKDKKAKV